MNHRVVKWRFGSLRQLAAKEGIPYHIVAPQTYRDEADVQHDLDILESQGLQLSCSTILQRGYKRLYDVIRETGWGAERVKAIPLVIWQLPPCDPHSGLLHDRMIKNIREWIYPDRPEVRDLLLKATAIDAVPVLIARRIPFVTFYLLQLCGAIVHQTFNQLLPSADQDPADLAKHKNNLGFHDIRTGNTPDKRMTKFIGTNLPAVLPKSYPVFLENKDLLRAFASQEITYRQFAAKLTTESNDPDPADFY